MKVYPAILLVNEHPYSIVSVQGSDCYSNAESGAVKVTRLCCQKSRVEIRVGLAGD